jgi:flagellar biogenesis protein FliO
MLVVGVTGDRIALLTEYPEPTGADTGGTDDKAPLQILRELATSS